MTTSSAIPSPMFNPNAVRIHDWPKWRGTAMDLVLYAGYLWGKDVITGAPWISWTDSVRLGANTSLCLTISNVNGLVLTIDKADLPTDSRTTELIDTVIHAISTHIDTEQTVSFNCLNTDNTFMRTSERRIYELRYDCNNE